MKRGFVLLAGLAAALAAVGVERATRREGPAVVPVWLAAPSASPAAANSARIEGTVWDRGAPARARLVLRRIGRMETLPKLQADWGPILLREFALPASTPAILAETDAAADGTFAFAGLGAGTYRIEARLGEREAREMVSVGAEGARVGRSLALRPAVHALHGRVLGPDGTPWRGAVALFDGRTRWPSQVDRIVRTDPEGRFVIEHLVADRYGVAAGEDGVFVATGFATVPASGDWTLSLAGREVSGTVVREDDGSPIPGADILAVSGPLGEAKVWVRRHVVTDAAERFSLPVAGKILQLNVRADGFGWTPDVNPVDGKPIVVRLARAGRVSGRVVAAGSGDSLRGLRVRLFAGLVGVETETDDDGRFEFPEIGPGSVQAAAQGGGWTTESPPLPSTVVRSGGTASLHVRVVREAVVTGRVLDETGAPVGGALVAADLDTGPTNLTAWVEQWTRGEAPLSYYLPTDTVATDEQGRFTVRGLSPGMRYRVSALAAGRAQETLGPFDFTASESRSLEIRLPRARAIWFQVLRADTGAPLEDVVVETLIDRAKGLARWGRTETDDEGLALLSALPPGPLSIDVSARGFVESRLDVEADATSGRSSAEPLVVRLEPGRTIAGRVLKPDGAPWPDARVSVSAIDAEGNGRGFSDVTHSGGEGVFRLDDVPAGRMRLEVDAGPGWRYSSTVDANAGDENLVVTVAPDEEEGETRAAPDALAVRVLDPRGDPVPEADARLVWLGHGRGATIRDGEAVLGTPSSRVPRNGEAWLDVYGARVHRGRPLPYAHARVGPIAPDVHEVTVTLEHERWIEGTVVDPDGKPVVGVRVEALLGPPPIDVGSEEEVDSVLDRTTTDAGGAFRVGGVGGSSYRVRVGAPRGFVAPPPLTAFAGHRLEIRLARGVMAEVRVLAPDGSAVANARVAVVPGGRFGEDDWRPRFERALDDRYGAEPVDAYPTDAAGAVVLPAAAEGAALDLVVAHPRSRGDLGYFRIPSWRRGETTVKLPAARTLVGVLRDEAGEPLRYESVHCVDAAGDDWSADSDSDGKFTFPGMAPGPATLRKTGGYAGTLRVAADETKVSFVVGR